MPRKEQTKNKFAKPPYLPEFNSLTAVTLRHILLMLDRTCCRWISCAGAAKNVEKLISNPSSIRKCDLPTMQDVVGAIKELEQLIKP